jgi:type I restriction enzyme S subunit
VSVIELEQIFEEPTECKWPIALLGDVCRTTSGGAPSRKRADYFNGAIPWVKSGELTDGLVSEVSEFISEEALAGSSAKLFPVGTLLIALYGATVGKLGLLTREAATNQAVCAIFPPQKLDTKFLFWYLRHQRSYLVAQAVGGAQPNISQTILRDLELPIPPLDEQREIVAEIEKQFSRLDEAVANLQRVKANLKRYKASVLKAAVEGLLVETEASIAHREGRTFESGEQLLQRIQEERRAKWTLKKKYVEPDVPRRALLASVPEGWTEATVEQLSHLVEYGSSSKTSEDTTGVPVLLMGNIYEGELRFDELKYLPHDHDEFPKLLLDDGDLLFNRTNSPELVGKVAVYRTKAVRHSFASYLIRVRLLPGALPEFLSAYLNSTFGRQWIKSVVTQQVGQANVNGTKLQALVAPLPPLAEQVRIVAEIDRRLSIVREVEAEVDANLQRAQALRQAVLLSNFTSRNAA